MTVQLTNLDFVVLTVYGILVVLGLGMLASRITRNTKRDYFLCGDKLRWWMIGGSIVAANISSHHLVGVMGTAYQRGFVSVVIEWGAILVGFNALLWVFLPFYLRNGFCTMPEFLQRRFGIGARLAYALLILTNYVFVEIIAVLYFGALAIHSLFGIPVMTSVIVLAVATGIYTISGGLRAVVWTEMLQLGVLLMGGLALSVATIHAAGGISALTATSSEWKMFLPASDPDFPWTMYLGGLLCISVYYAAANQFIVQRVLAAKNEWHARMGVICADYLKFLMPLLIVAPGMLTPKLFPGLSKPDLVFPTLVEHLLPSGLIGLVMAGLIAAVMSHISGAINSCTTIATVDFYLPFLHKGATDRQAVQFGRLMGMVVVALGILSCLMLIEHAHRPMFLYLLDAYGYIAPGVASMFLVGILWGRATHAGVLAAAIASIPLAAAIQLAMPRMAFFNRTGIVFWASIVISVVVSLFTTPKPAAGLVGRVAFSPQEVDAAVATVPAGSEGLCFWPLLATGAASTETICADRLDGIGLGHSGPHLVRAVMEGLGCELARYLGLCGVGGLSVDRLVLSGSAAGSTVTSQIIADLTGRPVQCSNHPAASAWGAAVLARAMIEPQSALDQLAAAWATESRDVQPGPNRDLYASLLARYQEPFAREGDGR